VPTRAVKHLRGRWLDRVLPDGLRPAMIYFYRRAADTRMCETRLEPDGPGFELRIIEGRDSHVERFDDVTALAHREHELRQEWRLSGWRTIESDDDDVEEDR